MLPLDSRSFEVVSTLEEFCGQSFPLKDRDGPLDICSSLEYVPGHDRSTEWEDSDAEAERMSDVVSTQALHSLIAASDEHPVRTNMTSQDAPEDQEMADEPSMEPRPVGSDENYQYVSDFGLGLASDELLHREVMAILGISGTGGGFSIGRGNDLDVDAPGSDNSSALLPPKPPCIPAIHLSASHLRLFDASSSNAATVVCSDVLQFQDPMYYQEERSIDRLNMAQHIPELGVVVLATQIGRAAVCSLTRLGADGPFGLRVDWILPFRHQEESEERPQTTLLGIAAGPVPGHEIPISGSTTDSGDDDSSQTWLKNRADRGGGFISFDPNIVRLKKTPTLATNDNSKPTKVEPAKSESKRGRKPPVGRKSKSKSKAPVQPTSSSAPVSHPIQAQNYDIFPHPWPSHPSHPTHASPEALPSSSFPPQPLPSPLLTTNDTPAPWEGIEYSRRFRLMLTYADHTVMTYELSRTRPWVGKAGRHNWRGVNEEG